MSASEKIKQIRIDEEEHEYAVSGGSVYGVWPEVSPAPYVLVQLGQEVLYRSRPQDKDNVRYWKFTGCKVFFGASFDDLQNGKGLSTGIKETVILFS